MTWENSCLNTHTYISPSQLLSFTTKGLEGNFGFDEVLIPVVLHIKVDLTTSRPLPQLKRYLPKEEGALSHVLLIWRSISINDVCACGPMMCVCQLGKLTPF